MTEDVLARYLLLTMVATMKTATPPLVVAAVVGFIVALFQGVTQIQDQSLPLTLKILAVGAVFLALGAVLTQQIVALADEAFRIFPSVTR